MENDNLYETIVRLYEGQIHSDEPIFYYHSDHLGSASFLTDNNGNETQQLVYLPFGEDWVDLKYNTQQFETPYKFNGKEKDLESSYNYYGARYYYDWLSIWLSVDPLSDKYPHLTSYNYCANNPVMLVDPDGRDLDVADNDESRNDIKLIVATKDNKDRIHFIAGTRVFLDIDGMTEEDIQKDKGFALLYEMSNSPRKYLYEANEGGVFNINGEETGIYIPSSIPSGVINASNNGRDSDDKHTFLPKKGYDGQVLVSPRAIFKIGDRTSDKYSNVRQSLIFHELMENFLRTDYGYDYNGNKGNDNVGAHERATNMEPRQLFLNPQPGNFKRVN